MNMKIYNFLVSLGLSFSCIACTTQDWYDSGISNPYHDCSIMEYLQNDSYNWELTVKLIEQAELTDMFEGNDPDYKEITFFAPPSYSILRYVWDKATGKEDYPNNSDKWRPLTEDEKNHPEILVQKLDKAWCREMIMKHVIKGKLLKEDFNYRNKDYEIMDNEQNGGTDILTEGNCQLRVYRDKSDYNGVPDKGAETMYIYSFTGRTMVPLATPNIQPINGVVHALNYNYILGQI